MTQITLGTNNLQGTIPTSLSALSNLTVLRLNGNQLSGTIPTNIGTLSSLQELSLQDNRLNGNLPTSLGNLSSIRTLNLGQNQLSGSIPASLSALTTLNVAYFNNNQLSGCFPASLSALCGKLNFGGNANLPGGGDFGAFCANGAGSDAFAPIATARPNPVCVGSPVSLSVSKGTSYRWSGPADFAASTQTPSFTPTSAASSGLYSVTVGNGSSTCTATATVSLTVNALPTANLSNNGPITCASPTVSLSASGGSTYSFSPGANQVAGGNIATVTQEGVYSVTVISNGCSSTATTTVTSNTTAPNASLFNNGPLTSTNPTVTLSASGGNTYAFSSGTSQQGGQAGNIATVSSPGTYQVTVTTSSNGCSATASTIVTGAVSQSSCRNGTAVITVVATGTLIKYEWYRNSISSARLTENPAQVRGTSTTSLTLVNQQVTADYYVRVTDQNGSAVVYGPFRMTVNLSCNIYARVGTEEVELRISLLGNPIQSDQLRATVNGASGKTLSVQLLDLSGKPIHQQQWQQAESNQAVEWNLSGQASGVYLLQANTEADSVSSAQRQSLKVIKP